MWEHCNKMYHNISFACQGADDMSKEGWEAVTALYINDMIYVFFRRYTEE